MFKSGGGGSEIELDFDIFGKPPPELTEFIHNSEEFELWPENAEPVDLFLRLQTQWRVGYAGVTGLDYSGVDTALRFMRKPRTPELFDQIQLMERAALDALAEGK